MKRKIAIILFLISTTIGIYTLFSTINQITIENAMCNNVEQSIIELKNSVLKENNNIPSKEQPFNVDKNMNKHIDWDNLNSINKDIVGWIYIPNTNIDYPILQEQNFGEQYYLHHDYKKDEVFSGSVFTPKQPYDGVDDAHMLLFAHRMKNKEIMFSNLENYYCDSYEMIKHQYAYLYKKNHIERWIVWCTKNTSSDDDMYTLPYHLKSEQYQSLIQNTKYTANNLIGNEPSANEKILILSTCSGDVGGSDRFFVVFKLDKTISTQGGEINCELY